MIALLDTDVLVDSLRGHEAARRWLEISADQQFQIPGIVAMELVVGCRDQSDLRRTQKLLSRYTVVWPEVTEFAQAFALLSTYRLSCGVSIPDCLIAAMSISRGMTLYTFNRKHYEPIEGLNVSEPYSRIPSAD
ncbi:MAG: type II toxin-antitoxin system VapC family toxin [Armatimonadetes bacterium]|nr:type II toxin-antitoxin system VapC family toxin [Armatimonadota bacterium]